jgi:hypothetical protein
MITVGTVKHGDFGIEFRKISYVMSLNAARSRNANCHFRQKFILEV